MPFDYRPSLEKQLAHLRARRAAGMPRPSGAARNQLEVPVLFHVLALGVVAVGAVGVGARLRVQRARGPGFFDRNG